MFYNLIKERVDQLQSEIIQIESKLSDYPEGELHSRMNGNRTKWYILEGDSYHYLPKHNRNQAEQLAIKKQLVTKHDEITKELHILNRYLKNIPEIPISDQLLMDPKYRDLLAPHFNFSDSAITEWQSEEYPTNPYHPEKLIHKTPLGYSVRSKSELLISLSLMQQQIPHRYECQLTLKAGIVYPDFTLFHPATHKIIYWEHLGMMDDPLYAQDASKKISRYIANGIHPGIQLILTSETQDHPLEIDTINEIIHLYI